MRAPGPPLDPSGDEGRSLLRTELLKKEYHDQHLWQRLMHWLGRLFDRSVGAASGSSPAVTDGRALETSQISPSASRRKTTAAAT